MNNIMRVKNISKTTFVVHGIKLVPGDEVYEIPKAGYQRLIGKYLEVVEDDKQDKQSSSVQESSEAGLRFDTAPSTEPTKRRRYTRKKQTYKKREATQ